MAVVLGGVEGGGGIGLPALAVAGDIDPLGVGDRLNGHGVFHHVERNLVGEGLVGCRALDGVSPFVDEGDFEVLVAIYGAAEEFAIPEIFEVVGRLGRNLEPIVCTDRLSRLLVLLKIRGDGAGEDWVLIDADALVGAGELVGLVGCRPAIQSTAIIVGLLNLWSRESSLDGDVGRGAGHRTSGEVGVGHDSGGEVALYGSFAVVGLDRCLENLDRDFAVGGVEFLS